MNGPMRPDDSQQRDDSEGAASAIDAKDDRSRQRVIIKSFRRRSHQHGLRP